MKTAAILYLVLIGAIGASLGAMIASGKRCDGAIERTMAALQSNGHADGAEYVAACHPAMRAAVGDEQ